METIRVPKPAPEAFHKNRRVSDLLTAQVAHFQHVAEKKALAVDPDVARDVQTEGGAARFIASVTRLLHGRAAAGKGRATAIIRRREAASEAVPDAAASGTVRRIAARAATPKKTKAGSATASKAKKAVKKAAKKAKPARAATKAKAKQRKRS
jgi:hypothetical protein